ncbi:MAG: hypothetical protein ACRYFX_00735 [Janthinobacterium lividum]
MALSAGVPIVAALLRSFPAEATEAGAAPHSGAPVAANGKEFREGVIGPAKLSLATSQIDSAGKTTPAESQTRHLATLALATFKEHVAITSAFWAS